MLTPYESRHSINRIYYQLDDFHEKQPTGNAQALDSLEGVGLSQTKAVRSLEIPS